MSWFWIAYIAVAMVSAVVASTWYLTISLTDEYTDWMLRSIAVGGIVLLGAPLWPLGVLIGGVMLIAWHLSGRLKRWMDERQLRVRQLKAELAAKEEELAEARRVVDSWTQPTTHPTYLTERELADLWNRRRG